MDSLERALQLSLLLGSAWGRGNTTDSNSCLLAPLDFLSKMPMSSIRNKLSGVLKASPAFTTDEKIILRDFLALQRTKLANERTFLSYTKFSLYLVTAGVALVRLDHLRPFRVLGYVALGTSGVVFLIGLVRFFLLRRQLRKFYQIDK